MSEGKKKGEGKKGAPRRREGKGEGKSNGEGKTAAPDDGEAKVWTKERAAAAPVCPPGLGTVQLSFPTTR